MTERTNAALMRRVFHSRNPIVAETFFVFPFVLSFLLFRFCQNAEDIRFCLTLFLYRITLFVSNFSTTQSKSDVKARTYVCSLDHSVYSIFEKTAGYVINRCLQTHVPFRG